MKALVKTNAKKDRNLDPLKPNPLVDVQRFKHKQHSLPE